MNKFKEWDVVYDPSDDTLMIYKSEFENEHNAWCEFSQGSVRNCVTGIDHLVYIGQFWTDKERLMHEKYKALLPFEKEIKRLSEKRKRCFSVMELFKLNMEIAVNAGQMLIIQSQPLPQFDENGMIKKDQSAEVVVTRK